MNKNDIKLIIILLLFIIVLLLILRPKSSNTASVYYEDKLIQKIDLTKDNIYTFDGYNGKVVVEVKSNKIKVIEENSKNHICSKQGYSNVIICLPNKIIIKVEDDSTSLDGVSK